jgi:hypothetical protein
MMTDEEYEDYGDYEDKDDAYCEMCCNLAAALALDLRLREQRRDTLPGVRLMVTRYIYRWNRMGRKGQACIALARGTMNSCMVQFDDGYIAITSRNALRRA